MGVEPLRAFAGGSPGLSAQLLGGYCRHGGYVEVGRSVVGIVDRISDWSYNMTMKKVAAAKFKEQCLSILDHLDPEGIVITKHGKPVARVLPMARASAELIGVLKGRIRVCGSIESTGQKWTASD